MLPHAPGPTVVTPSLLSVRANLIPSPPTFNSDYGYISWEAYANVSYYTRVLPPVPDNCPTPMGTKGTWLAWGDEHRTVPGVGLSHRSSTPGPYPVQRWCFPPTRARAFAAMDASARHRWQCHLLPLSCPSWPRGQEELDGIQNAAGTAQVELLGHVVACVRGL